MRILFLTPHQLWPVNSGARLRNLHLASALASRCQVTLFQITPPGEDLQPPQDLPFEEVVAAPKNAGYTPGNLLKGVVGPVPISVLNYTARTVSLALRELLRRRHFDSIQIEGCHLASYLEIFRGTPDSPSVLLDWHNIESELLWRYAAETTNVPRKLFARRTAYLLEKVESQLLRTCDGHTVVSERDKGVLLQRNAQAFVRVIPNGVDACAFVPSEPVARPETLLFVGSMDYHANSDAVIWFVNDIWPAIAQRYPDLEFNIVGRAPTAPVQALSSRRVHVTGTVDDVRPFYASAFAVVVPLRVGGGTRLKILEAMALGVPVISTTLGAEGISATHGRDILLADSKAEMLNALERLTSDPRLRYSLIEAGRKLAVETYDWSSIGDRLFEIHSELVGARVHP